jgi:hypothetical protein
MESNVGNNMGPGVRVAVVFCVAVGVEVAVATRGEKQLVRKMIMKGIKIMRFTELLYKRSDDSYISAVCQEDLEAGGWKLHSYKDIFST